MWKSRFEGVDPITGSTVAAVLCTVLTEHQSSRQSEFGSETVCWMMLPILFTIARRSHISIISTATLSRKPRSQPASSRSLWIFAIGIVTACCYKAEIGIIVLFPVITPLLILAEKHFRPELQASRMCDSWFFSPLVNTVWGTTLAALFAIFTISNWDLRELLLSVFPVAALLLAYITLIPRTPNDTDFLPLINVEEAIFPLSLRIVVVLMVTLGIQSVSFGLPSLEITPTLSLGLAKALFWYFTTRTTRYTSWCIATAIGTFSIVSSRDPSTQSSGVQAFSQVMASSITVSQIIHMLPKQAKVRSTLWFFILLSLVPYLANVFAIRIAQSSVPPSFDHPVEGLIHNAKANLEHVLQTQSKNYTSAYEEYRRRYDEQPPPGFEAWYEFAAANQSPIIDEFDTIFDMISPFWRLSGKEVIKIMTDVQNEPDIDLWLCTFSSDRAKTHCSHPYRTFDRNIGLLFDKLLGNLRGILPDLKFLVNHLDEPRVLTPPRSLQEGDSFSQGQFRVTDLSRKPSWDAITRFCESQQSNRSAQPEYIVENVALPFVTDRFSAMDLCQHPEYSAMHGLAISPTSFRLIEGLVPILSTGSPSTMGDLLFPSPAYIDAEFRYDEGHDIEWDRKQNKLYWAGSTTGGFALNNLWRDYHRHRFVKLAQNLERQQHFYLRERGGVIGLEKSSFFNGRLFDVAFTKIFQCEKRDCRNQNVYFKVKSWTDKDQALKLRLVFDIDGNGISGRYYKLLASKSVPLKQTILREWHDERLMPWVHYVPVSQGMEEVPELVFYLTSTKAGQQRAKEIAEQGRDWFSKAFRDIDLSIYTYRLLLELARLQDLKRQAS